MKPSAAQHAALEHAVHWYSLLQSGCATPEDEHGWQCWLQQSAANQWAWQQVEQLQQRLQGLPAGLTGRTLALAGQAQRNSRRNVLKGIALLLGGGTVGWAGYREVGQGPWFADYRTRVGEQLPVTLADGGQLLLNTDSAADVRYDARQRVIRLRQGEVMVTTAADPLGRPFLVETEHGRAEALGTRFSVRVSAGHSQVAVFEHQVRILPTHGQAVLLAPGQCSRFSSQQADTPQPLPADQDAWTRGLLVANAQRLDAFLPELGRYRAGWLRCDPAVAGLQVSGTFPIADTDKALRAIASVLPVKVERRTRFWVTLSPLEGV
ncbi:DUF4880 domain-containing protein [Pantoea sp. Tr-811]|uniref:FecR domain-containing protein n=1 Tax=Pantoea sp. Tr-811 TaxID=2608361 RepID=UPI00142113E6|nr:FecR domain-containing protein [Pantoea sp. Tr-811]NIF29930.1 DUF4880 domain-containing protein [Pantoea sp. Tr-811]